MDQPSAPRFLGRTIPGLIALAGCVSSPPWNVPSLAANVTRASVKCSLHSIGDMDAIGKSFVLSVDGKPGALTAADGRTGFVSLQSLAKEREALALGMGILPQKGGKAAVAMTIVPFDSTGWARGILTAFLGSPPGGEGAVHFDCRAQLR